LRQFLRYQGRLSGLRDELEDRVTRCLQQCRLEDQEDLKIGVLSKGAIQRLAMAQALVHDPDVLLLDEPLDGLDPLARNRFQTLIQELADEGKCILLATHLMEGLEDFCDEMIVLHEGKTLFQGAPRFDAGLEGWIVETLKAREAAGG
ncbi:MAG: ATP-binding cassette domain-containing protein, partial [Verrucomicrobiae bacterium]|nr:ATP-binding cassette domain-containing protein [Verrucomicrobiae bacterium]